MNALARRWLEERLKHNPRRLERILRLNDGWKPGDVMRGWNKAKLPLTLQHGIGKRRFIADTSRAHWDALPHGLKYRDGRRMYVTFSTFFTIGDVPAAYLDRAAAVLRRAYPTRHYHNDRGPFTLAVLSDEDRQALWDIPSFEGHPGRVTSLRPPA